MPRELSPCGTPAAVKRHRRKKEPLDEACLRAEREQKAAKRAAKQAESAEQVRSVIELMRPIEPEPAVDPLDEALDSLRIVRALLQSGEIPANTVAPLTKRRDELADRISRIQSERAVPEEVSLVEQLQQRRAARHRSATSSD